MQAEFLLCLGCVWVYVYVCMQVYTCRSGGQRQLSGESSILVSCVEFSIIIAYEIPALFLIGCSGSGRLGDTESSIYLPLKPKSVSVLRKVMRFLLFLWTHRSPDKRVPGNVCPSHMRDDLDSHLLHGEPYWPNLCYALKTDVWPAPPLLSVVFLK